MDFDGTQVKHTREEELPLAIIVDVWLHLFT